MFIIRFLVRITSFFYKEFIEIVRQPKLLVTIIFGPFLIMLLFGIGYNTKQEPIKMAIVANENSAVIEKIENNIKSYDYLVTYTGTDTDKETLIGKIKSNEIDYGVVIPDDAIDTVKADKHAIIEYYHSEIDPNQSIYIQSLSSLLTNIVNRKLIEELAREIDTEKRIDISPEVIARPFDFTTKKLTEGVMRATDFFIPGVVVLLLQHMMITLLALSLVREKRSGTMELFRVSPIKAGEILVSKYIIYLFIGVLIAAVLALLISYGLSAPMFGSWLDALIIIVCLIFASLGIGSFISVISTTETESVQFSMIVLLFSVFFSGFFIALRYIKVPIKYIANIIPASYATVALQNIMLRAKPLHVAMILPLLIMGGILFILAWIIKEREMAHE